MIERYLHSLSLQDAASEDIAATRERVKGNYARGATRRMTQLGMLVGATLDAVKPTSTDTLVYASAYAESRALEDYLDSFPTASPTLFQTSIHPSAVQQAMIGRQQEVQEFLPLTGREYLVGHALQAAALASNARTVVCGGEERGSWLLDNGVASDRSFAFAFDLTADAPEALARLTLEPTSAPSTPFTVTQFFDALAARASLDLVAAPGCRVRLAWL